MLFFLSTFFCCFRCHFSHCWFYAIPFPQLPRPSQRPSIFEWDAWGECANRKTFLNFIWTIGIFRQEYPIFFQLNLIHQKQNGHLLVGFWALFRRVAVATSPTQMDRQKSRPNVNHIFCLRACRSFGDPTKNELPRKIFGLTNSSMQAENHNEIFPGPAIWPLMRTNHDKAMMKEKLSTLTKSQTETKTKSCVIVKCWWAGRNWVESTGTTGR